MNDILYAIAGLLAIFIGGVLMYGVFAKSFIGDHSVQLTPMRFVIAAIGMFVISYAFIWLYRNVTITDLTGMTKGLVLGLTVGVAFFTIPLYADAPYFKSSKMNMEWVVAANWILSFALLGLTVGALIG